MTENQASGALFFKMYGLEYLLDENILELELDEQGILIRLWCLNSQSTLTPNLKTLARQIHVDEKR